jgi:hypothetical protein
MFNLKHGTMIAIAAGSLFAAACTKSETKEAPPAAKQEAQPGATAEKVAKVHCTGVNDCTGKGACKSAANACAGKNACKGQGFIDLTDEDCKAKGGTIMAGAGM